MSRRWFGDPVDEAALGGTLARLVGDVARLLDRLDLEAAPVAPAAARVDPEAVAVVLPLRRISGASVVIQVAEWSSSVGCWWSAAGDPMTVPAVEELFAEFPLRPDGPARALAWLEGELRRPVTERERGYRLARRQIWSVVLDDGRELAVRSRWQAGWTAPGSARPFAVGVGDGPAPGSGVLLAAVAAAAASWALAVATPTLFWTTWAGGAVRVLAVAALAGAVLLVVANSLAIQAGMSTLVVVLPQLLGFAIATTVALTASFGGAALLAITVALPAPQDRGGEAASPSSAAAGATGPRGS